MSDVKPKTKKEEKEKEKEEKKKAKEQAKEQAKEKKQSRKKKSKRQEKPELSKNGFVFDRNSDRVPIIVEECLDYLEKEAVMQEGIFRLSGSQEVINQIKACYVEGKPVDLHKMAREANDVAGLLKLYFREMPEALLTWELYECFLAAVGVPNVEARLECLRKVIDLLPDANKVILARLMGFLAKVASNQSVNKMNPQNLAIVFSPTLYRPKEETYSIVIQDSTFANKLIETFIIHYEDLFVKPAAPVKRDSVDPSKLEEFNSTMRKGTLRFAKKFLQEEKQVEITHADEELDPKSAEAIQRLSVQDPVPVWNVFDPSGAPATQKRPTNRPGRPSSRSSSRPGSATISPRGSLDPSNSDSNSNSARSSLEPSNSARGSLEPSSSTPSADGSPSPPKSPQVKPTVNRNSKPYPKNSESAKSSESIPEDVEEEEKEMTAKGLVEQLLQGKNVAVVNYLDTLSVEKRKVVVDEMSSILDSQH